MRNKTKRILSLLIIMILVTLSGCGKQETIQNTATDSLTVHFVDVGQGDCILLLSGNETMLIDAGNNKDGKAVVEYIKKQGINRLDYVVGTHPDADHIGGLDTVIQSFEVGKVYMPKKEHTTKTFEDVLLAVKGKGLKIVAPKVGDELSFGSAMVTFLAPIKQYEDNNNNSIVMKVQHGEQSFLFEGDAELESEEDMLKSKADLSATVLKVGHHGSHSSTSKKFLQAVKPSYAVISCGVDNSYGHPHKETMTYLKNANVEIYRTDQEQTIIMTSDGKTLRIQKNQPSAIGDKTPIESKEAYIGNSNSKKFHLQTCNALPSEKNRVSFANRKEAVRNQYEPCSRCNP